VTAVLTGLYRFGTTQKRQSSQVHHAPFIFLLVHSIVTIIIVINALNQALLDPKVQPQPKR
jgi:hypothetical protein